MSRTLTRTDANQTLRLTPERHQEVKHLAVDRRASMIQIADEVVAEGLRVLRARHAEGRPSVN